jgi:group I intron endonuclease
MINDVGAIPGIYKIENMLTGECYIGCSSNIQSRLKQHLIDLTNTFHINKLLQRSWDTHGTDAFAFSVVEVVADTALLPHRELHWIHETKALTQGFNTKSDSYKQRTLISIKPDTKLELEELDMGSMNSTLRQLIKMYRKQRGDTLE